MLKIILIIMSSIFFLFFITAIYACFIISGQCSEYERHLEYDQHDGNK